MENLKRYDIGEVDTGIGTFVEMVEEEEGRFVRYEEAIKLVNELIYLRGVVKNAKEDFNWMYNEKKFLTPNSMKYLIDALKDK